MFLEVASPLSAPVNGGTVSPLFIDWLMTTILNAALFTVRSTVCAAGVL